MIVLTDDSGYSLVFLSEMLETQGIAVTSSILNSWQRRMLMLFPALYATIASASFARSVPLALNARTTSSRPKRSKNAWAQTRLPMGTD